MMEERKPVAEKKPVEAKAPVPEAVTKVRKRSPVAMYVAIAAIVVVIVVAAVWYFVLRQPSTSAAAPVAPTLVSPANGAADVSPSPNLMLTWKPSTGVKMYELQVSADPVFSSPVVRWRLTDTSYVVAGLANSTKYFWRISASNSSGTSEWSGTWSFSTLTGKELAVEKEEKGKGVEGGAEVSMTYYDEVDVPPKVVGGEKKVYDYIDYTNLKMEAGFLGTVSVKAYVNEKGGVDKTEIVRGIDARFDNASVNAVRQLRFVPAKRSGNAVKSKTTITIQFQGK